MSPITTLLKRCEVSIRVMVKATTGKWSKTIVPKLSAMDAIKRFGSC
jgi:hypothetical protein